MDAHLLYSYVLLGKQFYQLGTGGDTERLHACMGSPVCDEEAEVDHKWSDHLECDVLYKYQTFILKMYFKYIYRYFCILILLDTHTIAPPCLC